MNIAEEIKRDEARAFCRNNGIVMRTILMFFKRGYFKTKELYLNLKAFDLKMEDVLSALDYFDDMGYIQTRLIETGETVKPCEAEDDEIELRLHAKGKLLGHNLIKDEGIEL